jgi:hypothetical protein
MQSLKKVTDTSAHSKKLEYKSQAFTIESVEACIEISAEVEFLKSPTNVWLVKLAK